MSKSNVNEFQIKANLLCFFAPMIFLDILYWRTLNGSIQTIELKVTPDKNIFISDYGRQL